jgi:hypothetical protein
MKQRIFVQHSHFLFPSHSFCSQFSAMQDFEMIDNWGCFLKTAELGLAQCFFTYRKPSQVLSSPLLQLCFSLSGIGSGSRGISFF